MLRDTINCFHIHTMAVKATTNYEVFLKFTKCVRVTSSNFKLKRKENQFMQKTHTRNQEHIPWTATFTFSSSC